MSGKSIGLEQPPGDSRRRFAKLRCPGLKDVRACEWIDFEERRKKSEWGQKTPHAVLLIRPGS
jgi:hypothetical protein